MKIKPTQENRDAYVAANKFNTAACHVCTIAQALSEMHPDAEIQVGRKFVRIDEEEFKLSEKSVEFVDYEDRWVDNQTTMEPQELIEIELIKKEGERPPEGEE